ncbi:histidine phosphatase family protein [Nocardia sp. NPDC004568]|uniref:histidine phosphatase family protein n=1 Tax=Nocardia sp. NPDC004568 TaxID=3154551 RepID=UPI0033BAC9FF
MREVLPITESTAQVDLGSSAGLRDDHLPAGIGACGDIPLPTGRRPVDAAPWREVIGRDESRGVRMIMICHGATGDHARDDIEGPYGGPGLSPRGYRQALGVANRLVIGEEAISAVYSTPLTCAVQTAQLIARALGLPLSCELPASDSARERHASSTCRRSAPIRQMGACLERIAERHAGGIVILVCHSASIMAAEQYFQRAPRASVTVAVEDASITEWERITGADPGSGARRWQRLRYNDIAHQMFEALVE